MDANDPETTRAAVMLWLRLRLAREAMRQLAPEAMRPSRCSCIPQIGYLCSANEHRGEFG